MSDDHGTVLYRCYAHTRFWIRQMLRWLLFARTELNPEEHPYKDYEWPR